MTDLHTQPHGPMPPSEGAHAVAERDRLLARVAELEMLLAIAQWAPGCVVSDDCDPNRYCQVCRASINEYNQLMAHFDDCRLALAIGAPLFGWSSPKALKGGANV